MSICVDLTGEKFGSLTVVQKLKINNHREMEWLCMCDCGKQHVTTSHNLTHNITTCCKDCKIKKIVAKVTKHGTQPIELWRVYENMKTRCYNPKYSLYHRYGGRGIQICDEWKKSFVAFRSWALSNGYQKNLTLDRIDNDGMYCPENCRWVTVTEQANNRSTNRIITVNGETDTLANWARKTHSKYSHVQHLLDIGKSGDEVFGHLL